MKASAPIFFLAIVLEKPLKGEKQGRVTWNLDCIVIFSTRAADSDEPRACGSNDKPWLLQKQGIGDEDLL